MFYKQSTCWSRVPGKSVIIFFTVADMIDFIHDPTAELELLDKKHCIRDATIHERRAQMLIKNRVMYSNHHRFLLRTNATNCPMVCKTTDS